jgi:outer membrane protein assembly factor BamD (BamD/ComL family)
MRKLPLLLLICVAVSCQSTPEQIPEDLSASEMFQLAQEAVVERNDYETALVYYQTFLERYPEDVQKGVEAEYEIAFIYYKREDYKTARSQLKALLAKYDREGAEILPAWPKALAEKVLAKIEAETSTEEE